MAELFYKNDMINTAIKHYLEGCLGDFNEINFAYAIMNKKKPAEFIVISNNPSWFEVYNENKYHLIDPVMLTASHRISPFYWDENSMTQFWQKPPLTVLDMAREYDITNGYTFVIHDQQHNLAVLSFMKGKECHCDFNDKPEEIYAMQMLLIKTHEKMHTLCNDFHNQQRPPREVLSVRENQILYWASAGKTYQEIAIILAITPSTVKFHMANVVRKFGVKNAKHAISIGIELQVIRKLMP
ncbi:LuxR family quorum-sensing system transcriptional regulator ExpR [Erwinia toletana]|uniref:LuxR family quorum-sensing system transcriptional regulator ExpR n=1 Tax=Winslowiella toletana TaxID=92490 RepID=A0ABS4PHB7_9GAMM|nr:LuxR family transcriptional regulator [Winslowiella toletana]MBP2171505.1 LuxR family quorum-sensing system transcriptional regulator ExpR [Winslowiella toletana]